VLAAVGVGAWLLVRDDDNGTTTPVTTAISTVPTSGAPRTSALPSTATTGAPTTSSPTTTAVATTAAPTAPPTTATAPPTTATALPTTAAPSPTTAAASASIVPGVGTSPDDEAALTAAQAVAAALADGDWVAVRRISPDEGRTDAQLETAYGPLTDVAIVPARITRANGQVDLRLGLVAHEDDPGGPATALLCAHWQFDPATRTVDRVSSVRLQLQPGRVDPATVAPDLARTCATQPLR
jgi:hypothetical protein